MKTIKLCSDPSGCCVRVSKNANGTVIISDEGERVVFTIKEWQALKNKIISGEL